jgi:hypothetical protein
VGSLGEGRDPERPGRDQALTTVDADGPANGQIAPRVPLIRRAVAVPGRPSVGSKAIIARMIIIRDIRCLDAFHGSATGEKYRTVFAAASADAVSRGGRTGDVR